MSGQLRQSVGAVFDLRVSSVAALQVLKRPAPIDVKTKPQGGSPSHSRGDVMTGAGTVSAANFFGVGWVSSNTCSCGAETRVSGQSASLSYIVDFSRHKSRTASAFAIGTRGATPPPVG